MARIDIARATPGLGGAWYLDLEAIKQGYAVKDGFGYNGKPITPGFHQVRQPSTALSVVLALSDGQVAYADGVGVYYSGRMNRDPLFVPADQVGVFDAQVRPLLEGAQLDAFRPLANRIDELPIHKAMKYGVSMAVLDAVAKAKHVTMSEVIADEYDLELIAQPLVLNHQVGPDWYVGAEKVILRRGDVIHTGSVQNMEMFREQRKYLEWLKNRIRELSDDDYRPEIHMDQYGHIGLAHDLDISAIADYLQEIEEQASPYPLLIEDPINTGDSDTQMVAMAALKAELERRGSGVRILADELCPTFEHHKRFAAVGAAHMQKVKAPDLGSISNAIECILYLKERGVEVYLSGSATGTERTYQVHTHIGLATRPEQLLAGPGMGVDEAHQVVVNEMGRAFLQWQLRREAVPPKEPALGA